MNGAPLDAAHGFPLRLIAPGWYGVANVKWLQRIEVLDTRYMAREYVTRRDMQHKGQTVSRYTSVGRDLLKSAPAKVTRVGNAHRIVGAAWGLCWLLPASVAGQGATAAGEHNGRRK
jgi:DMSO/TMAO reductase YedYZ molybdopterin-dependent catalytic subunit